jgi:predicted RNA binding protein YcfA (HicA-like mRNA interferase family)
MLVSGRTAVSSIEKLVARMRRNPRQVRFPELVRLLHHHGWQEVAADGSHFRFEPPDGSRYVIVVRPHGGVSHCDPAQVRRVLEALR